MALLVFSMSGNLSANPATAVEVGNGQSFSVAVSKYEYYTKEKFTVKPGIGESLDITFITSPHYSESFTVKEAISGTTVCSDSSDYNDPGGSYTCNVDKTKEAEYHINYVAYDGPYDDGFTSFKGTYELSTLWTVNGIHPTLRSDGPTPYSQYFNDKQIAYQWLINSNNNEFTFTAQGLPEGLEISNDGVISGYLADSVAGLFEIQIIATHINGESITGHTTWEIFYTNPIKIENGIEIKDRAFDYYIQPGENKHLTISASSAFWVTIFDEDRKPLDADFTRPNKVVPYDQNWMIMGSGTIELNATQDVTYLVQLACSQSINSRGGLTRCEPASDKLKAISASWKDSINPAPALEETNGIATWRRIDINPGNSSSYPSNFTNVDGNLFFTASDGSSGHELWTYDGSTATLVADIFSGPHSSGIERLTSDGSSLFFTASDGLFGREFWLYDGVNLNRLSDINPGSGDSDPYYLTTIENTAYFSAIDGTVSLDNSGNPSFNGTVGREMWKYDGISTSLVADINPGSNNSEPSDFTAVGDTLYFAANGGVSGDELWQYDGTNLRLAADINQGIVGSYPNDLTLIGDIIFFTASDGISGKELWQYDGTDLRLAADINQGIGSSSPDDLTPIGDIIFFTADDGISGRELWKYDGNSASLVSDTYPGSAINSLKRLDPDNLTSVGNTLYLTAEDEIVGRELWKFDGVDFSLVKDINPTGSSSPSSLAALGNTLYFVADDGISGRELWRTDGTDAGTELVADLAPGPAGSDIKDFKIIGTNIFFSLEDSETGNELWVLSLKPERDIALELLESNGYDQVQRDALLQEINAATSFSELHAIVVRMRNDSLIADPRFDTKRDIALGVLNAKGFDASTYDALLNEINAATSISELHTIIVRMREDSIVTDTRLQTKRTIALDVLNAKGFDASTYDVLLHEINAATSVSELHAIIVRMRSGNPIIMPEMSLTLSVTANDKAVTKPGPTFTGGDTFSWTYTVTNTGNADLHNILITQRQKFPSLADWETPCSFTTIAIGETQTCTANKIALSENYKALIVARSTLANGDNIEDKVDAFYRLNN
ncbi:MAG: ELWxxDGT repeat protein [Gammaproteobacteria bacterium]